MTMLTKEQLITFEDFESSAESRVLLVTLIEFLDLTVKDPARWPALETILCRALKGTR